MNSWEDDLFIRFKSFVDFSQYDINFTITIIINFDKIITIKIKIIIKYTTVFINPPL